MKSIWKWILGIVVVLVVVAGVVGLAFVMRNRMSAAIVQRATLRATFSTPQPTPSGGPANGVNAGPPGRFGGRIPPRMGPRMGFHGFGRGFGGGFGPFTMGWMFFGMLGRLVPIAIVLLLLYGAYRLGKGKAPVAAAIAPAPEPLPATPTHPCTKCQNPVQEGWKHCPNCGEEQ